MKRGFAALAACLALFITPALAMPGPDPGPFEVVFEETAATPDIRYDTITDGGYWDFGDREGYECVWMERFNTKGRLLFKVEIEVNDSYPRELGFRINDRGGAETEGVTVKPPIGTPDGCGGPSGQSGWVYSGEDHFPHHTHHHLFVNGVEQRVFGLHRDDCARGYWTPGDQAGEAILWWDVDGPTNDGHHDLPCNGGPIEPLPVARMMVYPVASNTGVCTHDDLDGSRCIGRTTPK